MLQVNTTTGLFTGTNVYYLFSYSWETVLYNVKTSQTSEEVIYVYSCNLDIGLTGIAIGSSILSSELPRNAVDWSGVEFRTRAPDLP